MRVVSPSNVKNACDPRKAKKVAEQSSTVFHSQILTRAIFYKLLQAKLIQKDHVFIENVNTKLLEVKYLLRTNQSAAVQLEAMTSLTALFQSGEIHKSHYI